VVESGSPGFTFGFDLNLELLRMSQDGLTGSNPPPPVVFIEPSRPPQERTTSPCVPQHQPPPAKVNGLPRAATVSCGSEPAEQELSLLDEGLHEEEESGEYGEEEEEEWADPDPDYPDWMSRSRGKGGGGGELLERTDMRNFNYDVIVDFVNQGEFHLGWRRQFVS
jgi:hypothetical protein